MSIPEDYRPNLESLTAAEIRATGLLGGGAVLNIARELIQSRNIISSLTEQLDAAKAENDRLRAALDKATGSVRGWWFKEARPIINAIGEISVQEAMDAIERDLK